MVCRAQLLEPLMLRRLKKNVQKGLPRKQVFTIWCGITEMQRFYYKRLLSASGCAQKLIVDAGEDDGEGIIGLYCTYAGRFCKLYCALYWHTFFKKARLGRCRRRRW
jgi:hypothetical protein